MKTLTLLRHAKSAWDDPVMADFKRPLNGRGRRAARAIGAAMRAERLHFGLVIASPARRVVETLADVADGYGRSLTPHYDERLYLAAVETLLEIVQGADDRADSLMLVGHNPGLEQLALFLTRGDEDAPRTRLEEKYPTGAVAEIRLPIDHWRDAKKGIGRLHRFIRPRDLDPELGPDQP